MHVKTQLERNELRETATLEFYIWFLCDWYFFSDFLKSNGMKILLYLHISILRVCHFCAKSFYDKCWQHSKKSIHVDNPKQR